MARVQPVYDDYFFYARPENRRWWSGQFANLTKADVTCKYCTYVTRWNVIYPKDAFRAHLRKRHPIEYNIDYKPMHVITEDEDDLDLVAA